MQHIDSVWQISIIAMLAGALIGALAYRLLGPSIKQADKIQAELDAVRAELDNYKTSVSQHFNKTSELVNDLTRNYVRVHEHLADGAQTLGDGKTFTNLLEQHETREAIAIDDETRNVNEIAHDLIVDSVEVQVTPVEAVDEHAEVVEGLSEKANIEAAPDTDSAVPEDDEKIGGHEKIRKGNTDREN